jgi:uncharacterized membrane protein YraQ (UPF0718 family)
VVRSEPAAPRRREPQTAWGVAIFTLVLVAGLYYAKWNPYYHKVFLAAAKHSIGASIVSGKAAAPPAFGWQAAWSYAVSYGLAVWQALIVGLLVGSGVQALLPRAWLLRVLGRSGYGSTAIAGLASVPGMMCTCCGAPVAVGLARSRASVGATLAFWIGNPILNPATIIFMGFVLGWDWVALRIAVGLILVFGVAHLAGRFVAEKDLPAGAVAARQEAEAAAEEPPLLVRWGKALWQLSVSLVPEYLGIVLALGAVRAWLFPAISPAVGHSFWLIPALAVTGTLFVVPTAGEIPIVQTLMGFGLGAGAAGALLTTLPPVSLPSLVMVGRALPARVLVFVAACVALLGVLTGAAALALGL